MKLLILVLVALSARADIITIDVSGAWASGAGAIHAGDAFSATASWEDTGSTWGTANFSLSTFPTILHIYEQTEGRALTLSGLFYIESPVGCSQAQYAPVNSYVLLFNPTSAEAICDDRGFENVIVYATDYHYSVTRASAIEALSVSEAPEARSAWLVGPTLALLIWRMRRSKRRQ